MKRIITSFCLLFIACTSSTESNHSNTLGDVSLQYTISNWKNGATGAYAIIFDDYCNNGTNGIQDFADSIASNRDVIIGFGVITSQCEEEEWKRAREMIDNGHEIIDHSHTHRCGVFQEGWCENVWPEKDNVLEFDTSTALIELHTGTKPEFFIFPFDLANDGHLEHLKSLKYLGARTGPKSKVNPVNFSDPFKLSFDVNFPENDKEQQGYGLNSYVDQAVKTGGFALREVHGVDDNSWGVVHSDTLRNHFDYVQTKVNSYEIWNAGVTEIIRYRNAAQFCPLTATDSDFGIELTFVDEHEHCKEQFELSVVFPSLEGRIVYFSGDDGDIIEPLNGVYNLKSNRKYWVR